MSGYVVRVVGQCAEPTCAKDATHEVRNQANATIRRCCELHARRFLLVLCHGDDAQGCPILAHRPSRRRAAGLPGTPA